ncbi:histone deacetylase family protein [Tuwongella immobilis]|uniref:histone deacetylase family protein n=1 Tax=Tuwongella immobilis TaxID=692036 RepID=UPI0013A68E61|nr:histone deacetylase [Tuwongella immobilis]
MKVFYTDQYVLPLPPTHTFPMAKYRLLRQAVDDSGLLADDELVTPPSASDEELERAHARDYVERVSQNRLTDAEQLKVGFPWSEHLVERSRRSSGATIWATHAALEDGCSINLAGGTHHAFRDRGEGYCLFNDSVVAARAIQASGRVRRVVVLDCDVHQGNGTASICEFDPTIYTFSIHGAKNYPLKKERSDLDIELPDRTEDQAYLDALERGLRHAIESSRAELAIYLAGADPYVDDRLGRMAVSMAGLAERDRMVFDACHRAGLPFVITMAGGYARRVEDTVAIHWQTVRRALRQYARGSRLSQESREKSR